MFETTPKRVPNDKKHSWRALNRFKRNNSNAVVLVVAALWILALTLDYQSVWMQPELWRMKFLIMERGEQLSFSDVGFALNYDVFEAAPRITRPLSSLAEIVNTKLRYQLWQVFIPHPAFSFTWLFSLLLSPCLLYRLLRKIGISSNWSIGGTALYITSSSLLSHITMLFRPGKPMVDFLLIYGLFLSSKLQRDLSRTGRIQWRSLSWLQIVLFAGFFFDETAIASLLAALIIFPEICFHSKRTALVMLGLLPISVILSYLVVIPKLTTLAGFPTPSLLDYEPIRGVLGFGSLELWKFKALNYVVLLQESTSFFNPADVVEPWGVLLIACNSLVVVALAGMLCLKIWRRKLKPLPDAEAVPANSILRWLVLLLAFGFLHGFLMARVGQFVWGPYWYGTYWGVAFSILAAITLDRMRVTGWVGTVALFVLCASSLFVFTRMNYAYKYLHEIDKPATIYDVYVGKTNRFEMYATRRRNVSPFEETAKRWRSYRSGEKLPFEDLPRELGYLKAELGTDHPGR